MRNRLKPPPPPASPEGWESDPLSNFLTLCERNSRATFMNCPELFAALGDISSIFKKALENLDNAEGWVPACLAIRTWGSYLAAARLVVSGELAEAHALMRACLESAVYAFYVHEDLKERERIWTSRGESENAKQRSRTAFRIGPMLGALAARDSVIGREVRILYDTSIEFGGHPNVLSVAGNAELLRSGQQIRLVNTDSKILPMTTTLVLKVGYFSLRMLQLVYPNRFEERGLNEELRRVGEPWSAAE
jgi:hypothetical protein